MAEEKKPNQKIAEPVKLKKKTGWDKAKGLFISGEASGIGEYALLEVIVPSIKNAIADIVTDGISMLLFGSESTRRDRGRRTSVADRVSYRDYTVSSRDDRRSVSTYSSRYSFDDIVFRTRGEADAVLTSMEDLITRYGVASVADLYEFVGIVRDHSDNNYGWSNLAAAKILRTRDGYVLDMPKALPIDATGK